MIFYVEYKQRFFQQIPIIQPFFIESNNKMYSQYQIHISQVLNSLDQPGVNLDILNYYLINHYSQNIPLKNQQQINRIRQILNIIHLNVHHKYLASIQRRAILQRLASLKFQNITAFQNTVGSYLRDCIQMSKTKTPQVVRTPQDPNQKIIKQILAEDEMQIKRQQQATYKLIQQLQLNQENQQKKRIEVASKQAFQGECPICLEDIKYNHLALLECGHTFHKLCTLKHFSQCIDDRKFPLKCPSCNGEVIYPDIQQYLTPQYQQKFQKNTFQFYLNQNQQNLSWCPTAGCEYVFVFDQHMTRLWCPKCKRKYCLKCKSPYHHKLRCDQKFVDKQFLKFVKGAKFKECSKCRRWIQKRQGCDHITCRCGHHFCYRCGGNYPQCKCRKNRLI